MKFDIVFSNPPYASSNANALDLKILNHSLKNSKKHIFVHPAGFLLAIENRKEFKQYMKTHPNLKKITLFDGNEIFKIGVWTPLCISEWDESYHSDDIEINDLMWTNKIFKCKKQNFNSMYVNFLNNENEYNEFIVLMFNFKNKDNIFNHKVKADFSDMTDFNFKFPLISSINQLFANKPNKPIFVDRNYRPRRKRNDERNIISFSNEYQLNNFYNFLKTKFVRSITSFYKIDQNLPQNLLKHLPWLDFNQHWDDKKLWTFYNIDFKLWNIVNEIIPNYYDDYESGFEINERK